MYNKPAKTCITEQMRTVNGVRIIMEPHIETHLAIVYRINFIPMALHANRDMFEALNRHKERFSSLLRALEATNLKDTLKTGVWIILTWILIYNLYYNDLYLVCLF